MSKYNNFHNKIKFLLELNKLTCCIYFEEITEEGSSMPWFNGILTSLYTKGNYWTPTQMLRDKIKELAIKYFKSDQIHYNNTGTSFWISDFGCTEPENMFYADELK